MLQPTQQVELYASFPGHLLEKSSEVKLAQFDFKKIFRTNGETGSKEVVLTYFNPFPLFPDYIDEDTEVMDLTEVKFKASLDQIFLDYDDCDLTEFGINGTSKKHWDAMDEMAEYENRNERYPVSNLIKFGLSIDNKYSWYGCYVDKIDQNDVTVITLKTNADFNA